MARFEAAPGLEQLVAAMVAPEVRQIAVEVQQAAQRREPGRKTWVTMADGRVCASCRPMHGVTIPTNAMFEVPAFPWETQHRGTRWVYFKEPPRPLPGQEGLAPIWFEKHQHQCRCRAVPAEGYDAGITTSAPNVAGSRVTATVSAVGDGIMVAEFGSAYGGGRFPAPGTRFLGGAAAEVANRRRSRLR